MTSMYQITDKGLEAIRTQTREKDFFQNWIEDINKSQGQFETYKRPHFTTVQGEAGFIELLARSKLNAKAGGKQE